MSGSTIGSVAGGLIGFAIAGPAGAKWGWMIGGAIGGYVDPDVIKGPRLENAQPQLSNEGVPRPLIYGRGAVQGNIIQCGPLVEHKKKERTGKGGPVQETYTYTRTVAIRICEGQVLGGDMLLRRAWMNDKLVYDRTGTGTLDADSAKFASILRFYSGSETQLPDPSLEALPAENGGGAGNVPAYVGTCYAVLTNLDCTDFGGAVPQFKWEVTSCGSETISGEWLQGFSDGGVAKASVSPDLADWATATTVSGANDEPNLGVFNTGTTLLFLNYNTADYKYSTDFNVSDGITTTAGTLPFAPAICRVLGPGQAVIIADPSGPDVGKWSVTTNGGATWSTPELWATAPTHNMSDWVRLDSGRHVVAVTEGSGGYKLFYSDDELGPSMSWTECTLPVGLIGGNGLVTNGSVVCTCSLIPGSHPPYNVAILRSLDGAEFVQVATSVDQWDATAGGGFGAGDTLLLPATGFVSIFHYSLDGGDTWDRWDSGWYPRHWTTNGEVIVGSGDVTPKVAAIGSIAFTDIATDYSGGTIEWTGGVYSGIAIPDVPGYYYDRSTGLVSGAGLGTVDPCVITLDEIVGDLTGRGGVWHYEVTALASDVVLGYVITQPTTAAGAIKSLQQVYFFDYAEWGNSGDTTTMLRAVKRGGPALWSLTDDDLIDADDEETRAQAVEFPRKLNFISLSPDANYNPIKQTAERESENVRAIGEVTIDTAVIFERDEAARRADILSKVMTEEALGRAEVVVPEEFTRYVTSDPGTWKGKRWRIDKIEAGDGESKWFLTRDRASAYISTALGATALAPTPAVSSMRGKTMFAAMNLPRLRSQDSTPGMYIAVCGIMPAWAGCDLYLSTDGGLTEQRVATIIDPAVMGKLTAGIGTSGEPLSIDLYDGEVDDATDAQLAARMNAAAVTSSGVSEILQFKDADQIDNLADLTTLTRGLLATTEAAHATGDQFVVLDGSVYFLPLDISLAGQTLIFRPVSRGTVPANNATYTVTFNPLFTGPQVVETITVGGDPITVGGQNLFRTLPDA